MRHSVAFVEFLPVADIGAVVGAMLAITVLMGLFLIAEFGAKLFSWIPVVGGPIAGAFNAASRFARSAMGATLDGTLHFLSWSWHAIVRLAEDTWNGLRQAVVDLETVGRKIILVDIPNVNHALRQRIDQVNRLVRAFSLSMFTYVLRRANEINRELRNLIAETRNYVLARIDQVNRELRADLAAVFNYLQAEITSDVKYLTARMDALFNKAEADAIQGDAATLIAAVNTALRDVDTEARDAASVVWAGIESELSSLEHVVGSDFPEFLKLLQEIPTVAPVGLATALTVALRFIPPAMKITADCTIPTCRDLGPLRDLLHILAEAGTLAALLAWLIFCITDPEAAAQDTADVLNPIAATVMQPLLDLLGAA